MLAMPMKGARFPWSAGLMISSARHQPVHGPQEIEENILTMGANQVRLPRGGKQGCGKHIRKSTVWGSSL